MICCNTHPANKQVNQERNKNMSDTLAFLEKFKTASEKLKQAAPDMMKGFGGLFASIMKDGALKAKEKELVALGIEVAQRCEPCINLHVQKCLAAGNTPPKFSKQPAWQ
jgi:AhpD family alkylhydroperoxidase